MYYDTAEGHVFRPPSEANSFILRVTTGCSHNRCIFCQMYAKVAFRRREWWEIEKQIELAARCEPNLRRVFLADGNALVLPMKNLLQILAKLKAVFPKLSRVTCYGGPLDILAKSVAELSQLKAAGLHTIYLGMESGSDEVLKLLKKGVSAAEMITAGQKVRQAGLKLSVMVILGAGGQEYFQLHGQETGKAVSLMQPSMLAALTLLVPDGSVLQHKIISGEFVPLSPTAIMQELQQLLASVELPPEHACLFRSDHVSNLLALAGSLPKDKARLLAETKRQLGVM